MTSHTICIRSSTPGERKEKFKDFTTQTSKFRCTYYSSRKLLKYPTSFEYKIQTKINYGITGKKQNKTKHNKTGEIACQI
jgi:hypothetical protein